MCVWVVHKYFGFVEEGLFSDDLVEGLIPNESINMVIIEFDSNFCCILVGFRHFRTFSLVWLDVLA